MPADTVSPTPSAERLELLCWLAKVSSPDDRYEVTGDELRWLLEARRERDELRETAQRNQRIVDLVTAPGSRVEPSKLNRGMVVVVDGRTGLDACERTADAAFDTLFEEADGGASPGRITLTGFIAAGTPEKDPV